MENFLQKFLCALALITTNMALAETFFDAQTAEVILKRKDLAYEDFEHPNKGCPENSLCDASMGEHRKKWLSLLQEIKQKKMKRAQKISSIENFRTSFGLPVEFYGNQTGIKSFMPIVWKSECEQHNPKDKPQEQIFFAQAFIKNTQEQKVQIIKGKESFQIEQNENFQLNPIVVYQDEKPMTFFVPKGEAPLYMDDDKLFLLREDEGVYYGLEINANGEWKVVDIIKDQTRNLASQDEVLCPKEESQESKIYKSYFCRKVWDEKSKKTLVMKLPWSC